MVALANVPVSNFDSLSAPRNHDRQDLELTHRIDIKTFRQVRDLRVMRNGEGIELRGQSESYYVKQLATHAVLDLFPGLAIENAIAVGR